MNSYWSKIGIFVKLTRKVSMKWKNWSDFRVLHFSTQLQEEDWWKIKILSLIGTYWQDAEIANWNELYEWFKRFSRCCISTHWRVILVYVCVKLQMRLCVCHRVGLFWVHFGSILVPFWVHFGSILDPFCLLSEWWCMFIQHSNKNRPSDKNWHLVKNQCSDKNVLSDKNSSLDC